ncbi:MULTISPECIES: serine hydrolase [Fusobacterium]|jgi:beta-lactamase class A|uniref:Serine hydrolase n=1 Tax=Fusobacterium hominis TaxID=2764326 RepID=A0A7G9GYM9_9FUSO|nr:MULTISPECIES: serine hydrolase [Fusobacterium]QNM15911.1 serine hydrolase [Fusobacterium hominis]
MLKNDILKILEKYQGTYGVLVKSNSEIVKINVDEIFPSASLIKLFILLAINNSNLDNKIKIDKKDIVAGEGALGKLSGNLTLSVRDLATLMIILSDNMATNILIDYLSMDYINNIIRENGFKSTILQRKMLDFKAAKEGRENYTSPRDVYQVLKLLYKNSLFLNMLKNQHLNNKISLYLSENEDFIFAHKTGELKNIEHDAGRLFYKDKFIDIVVMSKNLHSNGDGIKVHNEIGELLIKMLLKNN